jgi:hypothetical protein
MSPVNFCAGFSFAFPQGPEKNPDSESPACIDDESI